MSIEARIDRSGIAWDSYPYMGASVFPSGRIPWTEVREVEPKAFPPELRTRRGETLFVPAKQREDLVKHADAVGVKVRRSLDVWGLLLQPFLDTSFDPPEVARVNELLASLGVSGDLRERIRRRIGPLMRAFNLDSGLWEWTHLGLDDLLAAVNGAPIIHDKRLVPGPARRARLYRWAMAIAERGRSRGGILQ